MATIYEFNFNNNKKRQKNSLYTRQKSFLGKKVG